MKPVDIMKLARLDRDVKRTLQALQENDAKRFMPGFYAMSIVLMASGYVELGAIREAIDLLVLNAPEFYTDELPKLMLEDPLFRGVVTKIADFMVDNDIASVSYEHSPHYEVHQSIGEA